MSAIFLKILNMSITASWLILAVVFLRLLLKKAPKWAVCLLWALVAVRLTCPFSLESAFSLIPSGETIPPDIALLQNPAIHSGITIVNEAVNPVIAGSFAPDPAASANPLQIMIPIAALLWAAGAAALLIYALIGCQQLRRAVSASVPVGERIMACDEVRAPFIFGVFRPRICVPSAMDGETLAYVIDHENAHIQRRDHWWKALGFLLLSVHWFNPLCWLAYILLRRDMEMACDERVVRDMDRDGMAAYSQALLRCSLPGKRVAVCLLAFGEVGVKERVRGILRYKKPAFWITAIAFAACGVTAVCFLTNPKENEPDLSFLNYENAVSTLVDMTEVQTIYYPPVGKEEDGAICPGYVSGKALAEYLDLASWEKRNTTKEGLPSPGSIEFCIRGDYRITVYRKPRLAKVTSQNEVRCYRIHDGDYEKVVALFYATEPASIEATAKVAYADRAEDDRIYTECLNPSMLKISSVMHLPVYKLETKEDLGSFEAAFRNSLTLDRGYDEVPSFHEVTAGYDDSFFAGHTVILAYVGADSGSFRYGIRDISLENSTLCLNVFQTNDPEVHTDDMAGWFVIAEVAAADIAACTGFDARIVP